jgi:hypothetical protein
VLHTEVEGVSSGRRENHNHSYGPLHNIRPPGGSKGFCGSPKSSPGKNTLSVGTEGQLVWLYKKSMLVLCHQASLAISPSSLAEHSRVIYHDSYQVTKCTDADEHVQRAGCSIGSKDLLKKDSCGNLLRVQNFLP